LASIVYDNYEDSIAAYVRLATELFGSIVPVTDLSIENAQRATDYGKGAAALVGTDQLSFIWMKCEEGCRSGTWN